MFAKLKQLHADDSASTFIESAATMLVFMLFLFGIIEFSFLYYQWNAATKAVQFGARQAAVSPAIPTGFTAWSGVGGTVFAGDSMPAFDVTCIGSNAAGSAVSCTGTFTTGTASALQTIVFGRNTAGVARSACDHTTKTTAAERRTIGMCNFLFSDRLRGNNVEVRYSNTGLGYAGRPGGPVPTIQVSLRNMTYQFIFLNGLMGFAPVNMPTFASTVTGEDLAG